MDINQDPQIFLFLSGILGKKIIGIAGETLGKVYDLSAEFVDPYPIVTGIIFSSAQKEKSGISSLERCCRFKWRCSRHYKFNT